MKKQYLIYAILLLGIGLSLFPLFASTLSADDRQVSITVGPAIEQGDAKPQSQLTDCAFMGISGGYDYSGFPFVTHTAGDNCFTPSVFYPLGVVLNLLIVTVLVFIIITIITRRRKS
jgi:hypothetical protein